MWWDDKIILPFIFCNSCAQVLCINHDSLEAWMSSYSIHKILSYSCWQSRVKLEQFVSLPFSGRNDILDAGSALSRKNVKLILLTSSEGWGFLSIFANHSLMWEWSITYRTRVFVSSDHMVEWINKFTKICHTSQLELNLEELVTVLKVLFSVDESEHWGREHFLSVWFVVVDVSECHFKE